MQAGFARYGDETVLYRAGDRPLPEPWTDAAGPRLPDPAGDAARRARRCSGCTRPATPQPVQRLEAHPAAGLGAPGRELAGPAHPASPRSSGSPTSRRSSRRPPAAARTAPSSTAFVQIGVAKEDQPHYLKILGRPGVDVAARGLRPRRHRRPDRGAARPPIASTA